MTYERVAKLALERGFYFPSCEVYGDAQAGFWEYGPSGVAFKARFLDLWRRQMVRRDSMMEIDGSQVMSKAVFESSGHLSGFADPITRCAECGATFRADKLLEESCGVQVPEAADPAEFDEALESNSARCKCGGKLGPVKRFNMMFQVGIGPESEPAYLRPETCQSIFVDAPRLFKTMRVRLPQGVAQVGKSFRNEIAPRQGLLRLREFYQAEIEVFCNPARLDEAPRFGEVASTVVAVDGDRVSCAEAVESGALPNKLVAYYVGLLSEFYAKTGIDMSRARFRRLGEKEKAFYAETALDLEVETSTGWLELVACNYRSDHDLAGHARGSGEKFEMMDGDQKVLPHIFEISMGIDRSLYAILEHSMRDDPDNDRAVLSLPPRLAPVQVGVLSLVKKDGLKERADELYDSLKLDFAAFADHSGAIGRRYRRLDEVGCPFALTVDHQTLEDGTVTLRERDSMGQSRVPESEVASILRERLA